ncbi:MAG: DUF5985 family protein [Sphingomonas bacterium]
MLSAFLAGAITMGCATAGLFFLRFWKRTRDRLFIAFALAFWLLAFGQTLLTFSQASAEERTWLYLIRLVAFALILLSIWQKNRRKS